MKKRKKPARLHKKTTPKYKQILTTYCNKYTITFLILTIILTIAIIIAIGETSWYNQTLA